MRTWIVVADSAQAKIYRQTKATQDLQELASMQHLEGRAHDRDLAADRSGRSFDSIGGGRHAMEQRTQPREHSTIKFAKRIAAHLERGRQNGDFSQLVLFAAPAFLGHLRSQLSVTVTRLIAFQSNKDLVHEDADSVRVHLPDDLHRTLT